MVITGLSGSGKSSLITDTLYPALSNHLHDSEYAVGAYRKLDGIDEIDKVTKSDIRRVANKTFRDDNRTVATMETETEKPKPTEPAKGEQK